MEEAIVGYAVKLRTELRRDGTAWLASCPAIDVVTQAGAKKQALANLAEAVELWFESCIARGVLEEALAEVGFARPPGVGEPDAAVDEVRVLKRKGPLAATKELSFNVGRGAGADYIEAMIPAA